VSEAELVVDTTGEGVLGAELFQRTQDIKKAEPIAVSVSVPSTKAIADSEALIQANLERQRRRADYAQQFADWRKLPFWKRLRIRRPKPPT
jgi:hypothetical protein